MVPNSWSILPTRNGRFNPFFYALGVVALFVAGCETTPKDKKESADKDAVATIRLHVEVGDRASSARTISLVRSSPVEIKVESESVIDERDVKSARIIEANGSFLIGVEFNMHGRLVLEMTSVAHLNRRLAIQSTWSTGKETPASRWLAAPQMTQALRDGSIAFTPDASREEARQIVLGLNHIAVKLKNQPKPGKEDEDKSRLKSPDKAEDAIKAFQEPR